MTILELAAELGNKIKEDERITRMNAATAKYESDPALTALVDEYNALSQALGESYGRGEDEESTKATQERIKALYDEITANPVMTEYQNATEAVNKLMNDVNAEITYRITGSRPCSHDCSSCSGCH